MEKQKFKLLILSYSQSPGPRYCNQGDDSGEDFYHKQLNQKFAEALMQDATLIVDLDGPDGYASSFLDEAFGNLVYDFSLDIVLKHIDIKSEEEDEWIDMLKNETFKEWEKRRTQNNEPKKTLKHAAWYKYLDGKLKQSVWVNL